MNKKLKWASLLIAPLLLTGCDVESASGEISDSISSTVSNALPNLWVSLAQLGAFLVTVFVFIKFAYKPLKKKLEARKNYVETNIKESEQAKAEAVKSKDIAENNIKASRIKANEIIENATRQAKEDADRIRQEAMDEASRQKELARKDIEEEKKELERNAHDEIVSTALDASKEILGRELTKDDNDRIIADFIEKKKEEKK